MTITAAINDSDFPSSLTQNYTTVDLFSWTGINSFRNSYDWQYSEDGLEKNWRACKYWWRETYFQMVRNSIVTITPYTTNNTLTLNTDVRFYPSFDYWLSFSYGYYQVLE